MTRRDFIRLALRAACGSALVGGAYAVFEAKACRVVRHTVALPRLRDEFAAMSVAFLSDIHHSAVVPRSYIREVVEMTNALAPDLILLGGDYITHGREWAEPCAAELGRLRAPAGVFAVLGNHDHYGRASGTVRRALRKHGIVELTNSGVWLRRRSARLRICGVGDLWCARQDLNAALGDTGPDDAALLLSHNPDYVERIRDPRVGLVLSAHTHGCQCVFPVVGAPCVPSRYGQKYLSGLCQGPVAKVFVTRGVGTLTPAVRFRCPPEVALISLAQET